MTVTITGEYGANKNSLMPISGETRVVGVFGDPVAHTLSPPMHQAAFKELGLNWVYVPFHVRPTQLKQAVDGVRAMGLQGVNVTVPHKVHVMRYVDEVDEEARLIGAVNTIVNDDGRLIGYNTDGRGFVRSLELEGFDLHEKKVLLLGAGGAALAIASAVARSGATEVTIANRTVEKAQQIATAINQLSVARAVPLSEEETVFIDAANEADIVVQCTSIGMYPNHDRPPIVPVQLFRKDAVLVDIVYTPRETSFIRDGRARGCPVVTGEGMLAFQGAIALELWTGTNAPEDVMLQALIAELKAR